MGILPGSKKKYRLTKTKVKELETELEKLETVGRKEIADNLNWLRSLPNNQEDDTFSDLLEDKRFLEKRINEIKEILSNYEVVKASKKSGAKEVEVGSVVTVGFESFEEEYSIVSALEANPMDKKVSDESPIGKALLGFKEGDTVTVDTDVVSKEFRILKIK